MKNHSGTMEDYAEQLQGLKSYINELNDVAAKHGTDRAAFEQDLLEAEHNVLYYEAEIARLKNELGQSGTAKPPDIAKPAENAKPAIKRPGILSLVLTPISFIAGALLGSKLKKRK